MKGIDISSNNHQGEVFNFAEVKAAGYDFVYVKATQGISYTNPYLIADVRDAFNAGLEVGVYHFYKDGDGTPAEQATFFKANGIQQPVGEGHTNLSQFLTLLPVFDYEDGTPDAAIVTAFGNALGEPMGLYQNRSFNDAIGVPAPSKFLWLAWPEWVGEAVSSVTAIVQTVQEIVQGIGENPNGSHAVTDIDIGTNNIGLIFELSPEPPTEIGENEEMVFNKEGGQDHLYVYQANRNRTVHYWQASPGTAPPDAPADFYAWHSEVLTEPA